VKTLPRNIKEKKSDKSVPLSQLEIDFNHGQSRHGDVDTAHVDRLKGLIARDGLQEPIEVKTQDGRYGVIEGNHRTRAMKGWCSENKVDEATIRVPIILRDDLDTNLKTVVHQVRQNEDRTPKKVNTTNDYLWNLKRIFGNSDSLVELGYKKGKVPTKEDIKSFIKNTFGVDYLKPAQMNALVRKTLAAVPKRFKKYRNYTTLEAQNFVKGKTQYPNAKLSPGQIFKDGKTYHFVSDENKLLRQVAPGAYKRQIESNWTEEHVMVMWNKDAATDKGSLQDYYEKIKEHVNLMWSEEGGHINGNVFTELWCLPQGVAGDVKQDPNTYAKVIKIGKPEHAAIREARLLRERFQKPLQEAAIAAHERRKD